MSTCFDTAGGGILFMDNVKNKKKKKKKTKKKKKNVTYIRDDGLL